MIFGAPITFAEALQRREVASVLPTSLSSAELEQIDVEILERATFSARVTSAEYLDEIDAVLAEYVDGKIDLASARLRLKEKLKVIGYRAEPGEEGTLKDFSSDVRTNLVLRTNAAQAQGYGDWMQGQDPAILDQWPAQELYRARNSKVPRKWRARWSEAGGKLINGRMVARKNAPIWSNISRFGSPYPPFDFNSGMDVADVDRKEAMALGLIDRDTQIKPQTRGFNDDLKFAPSIRSAALKQALVESDDRLVFDGDVLSLRSQKSDLGGQR